MKNKILALLASVGLVTSASAVDVNENLKIQGFLDFSYTNTEQDAAGVNTDTQSLEMDEVEIDFLFNVGDVTGEVHLDNGEGRDGNENFDIEQAHFTYSLDNGVAFKIGNFGSALGFEREDPAGLYTFSRAYGDIRGTDSSRRFNIGDVNLNDYHGISVSYSADSFTAAASLVNPDGVPQDDLELNNADLELSLSYTGFDNVTIGAGYLFHNEEDKADEVDQLNIHISTSVGKLFLAAEYSEQDAAVGSHDMDAYMILADYDFTDKLGAALRISSNETDTATEDYDKITIAPNYSLTDSLGVIVEYSDVDQGTTDQNEFAVELTYTF